MSEELYVVFIQDDEGDVTRGPVESQEAAIKRMSDATSGGSRFHKAWMDPVP